MSGKHITQGVDELLVTWFRYSYQIKQHVKQTQLPPSAPWEIFPEANTNRKSSEIFQNCEVINAEVVDLSSSQKNNNIEIIIFAF